MPTEAEKKLHRCCCSGHRPEKLDAPEDEVKKWLGLQIDAAIAEGFCTFICGMGMGVEIWAGEIVLEKKKEKPSLHLICAVPWPGFPNRWSIEWHERYSAVLRQADLAVPVSRQFDADVFRKRSTTHAGRELKQSLMTGSASTKPERSGNPEHPTAYWRTALIRTICLPQWGF